MSATQAMVTPLVAIMKDQVEQLQSIGIRAMAIGLDKEEDEFAQTVAREQAFAQSRKMMIDETVYMSQVQ